MYVSIYAVSTDIKTVNKTKNLIIKDNIIDTYVSC